MFEYYYVMLLQCFCSVANPIISSKMSLPKGPFEDSESSRTSTDCLDQGFLPLTLLVGSVTAGVNAGATQEIVASTGIKFHIGIKEFETDASHRGELLQ